MTTNLPPAASQSTRDWNARYLTGDTPWEETAPTLLVESLLRSHLPPHAHILEIGCGLGTNALHLASLGFQVTALDIAPEAIRIASSRARSANLPITFLAADFFSPTFTPPPNLACAFDKGCFHTFRSHPARLTFAHRLASLLPPRALWLNISGSPDQPDSPDTKPHGAPRLSATEILAATEPAFQLLHLQRCHFGQTETANFPAFATLLQRRTPPVI